MIHDTINKLIRKVNPNWITTNEKLRILEDYYAEVVLERTMGNLFGVNEDYTIICKEGGSPSDVHLGKSRKEAVDRAYQELHKIIFFTQLHMTNPRKL